MRGWCRLTMTKRLVLLLTFIFSMTFVFSGCLSHKEKFTIISGSENKTLEPIIERFEKKYGVDIEMHYKGSVDIMLELEKDNIEYDAVWPANSLWIAVGDNKHIVKHQKSIMTTPVVFGVKMSLAKNLGFFGRDVSVNDILSSIKQDKLSFMMTSATQSNSGASAYMGFLYALLGNPEVIKSEDLHNPELRVSIRELLSGINRSSGSSEWLKELFLKGDYDAMVNYEAMMIEANQELERGGREPLYVIYPYDGLALADSPLGYVNKGDSKKEELFLKFQEYLLSEDIQNEMLKLGRRTGIGSIANRADEKVFRSDWGIDVNKVLSPIRMPAANVIKEALNMYQTEFRKPSYTIFCLDYSGSMGKNGEEELKEAMTTLLDEEKSKTYLLQPASEDKIIVIPFSDHVLDIWEAKGTDPQSLSELSKKIVEFEPGGGTDIYSPVIKGFEIMKSEDLSGYIPAVILMTDGLSNTGANQDDLEKGFKALNKDIPVFSIMFGQASEDQLNDISELTRSRVFDGKSDLIDAFKKARGYN